ncbi:hypothetical protein COB57_02115 [Candidatus Peregrinibacteria bacterium]|nr:MAG: hypothetical protein COB57_02115 [Candidatus Peregrinibacteria bacterium]
MNSFTITKNLADKRLDKVLKSFFPEASLSFLYKSLRKGNIKVNKKKKKPDYKTQENDTIVCFFSDVPQAKKVTKIALHTKDSFFIKNFYPLFEDDDLLVLNKIAKIAVHPGSKHNAGKTMLDIARAHTAQYNIKDFDTTLVHRLDLETSGILIFAKNASILRKMNDLIQSRHVRKYYTALCYGVIEKDSGSITTSLERTESKERGTKIRVSEEKSAKKAVTHYHVLKRFRDASLIKLKIDTGRMHQIRVHMKSIEHPILGDNQYGDFAMNKQLQKAPLSLKRMFLHASEYQFTHPITNKLIKLKAPLPPGLTQVVDIYKKL